MAQDLLKLLDDPEREQLEITVDTADLDPEAVDLVPKDIAERLRVVALAKDDKRLLVGMADPRNLNAIDDVSFLTGRRVVPIRLGGDVDALKKGASDVRIAGDATSLTVRYRVFGRWVHAMRPPRKLWAPMVGRIKQMRGSSARHPPRAASTCASARTNARATASPCARWRGERRSA